MPKQQKATRTTTALGKPATFTKNGKRVGAPLDSMNAYKWGLDCFTKGRWPLQTRYVPRICKQIVAGLRAVLVERDGATNVYTEAILSTINTHEARALLLERRLRKEGKTVDITTYASILEKIGNARTQRDKCLQLLGLDKRITEDVWQQLKKPAIAELRDATIVDDDDE